MTVSMIVAMDRNRVIGHDGDLPWHLSEDLKRFKQLTMGHHIIMGRKTLESIGRLLPGRTSVVVTRQADFDFPGAVVVNSLQEAIDKAKGDGEAFIIGGAEIYNQSLVLVDRIYLTEIDAEVTGDATFPDFERAQWSVIERTEHTTDERNDFPHSFTILDRRSIP